MHKRKVAKLGLVECDMNYKAVRSGDATVTVK